MSPDKRVVSHSDACKTRLVNIISLGLDLVEARVGALAALLSAIAPHRCETKGRARGMADAAQDARPAMLSTFFVATMPVPMMSRNWPTNLSLFSSMSLMTTLSGASRENAAPIQSTRRLLCTFFQDMRNPRHLRKRRRMVRSLVLCCLEGPATAPAGSST